MNQSKKKEIMDVFDKISYDFSETRNFPWPEVTDYLKNREEVRASLDVGCGNGRHMKELIKKSKEVFGLDISREMLRRAKKNILLSEFNLNNFYFTQGDAVKLPFKEEVFDLVICIATLHHIPSRKGRKNCLDEIYRVMTENSFGLISVWSIEHSEFNGKRKEIRENNYDYYIDWRSEGLSEKRYYHIFNRENLISLLKESKLEANDIELSSGNYYVEISK